MKRAMRRTGAPPRETADPHMEYRVPRHQWPAAWSELSEAAAVFVTGLGQETRQGQAAPISVFVGPRGAAILERLGLRLVGGGTDPWVGRMREFERQKRAAEAEQARHDASRVDAFEAAFKREAERVRAQQQGDDRAT